MKIAYTKTMEDGEKVTTEEEVEYVTVKGSDGIKVVAQDLSYYPSTTFKIHLNHSSNRIFVGLAEDAKAKAYVIEGDGDIRLK